MSFSISSKLEEYNKRFPLYTREAIVEMMLQDGVITPEVAQKINSGVSIFILDQEIASNNQSFTEVFGGYFSKKEQTEIIKTHPNTKLISVNKNGEIIPEQFTIDGLKSKFDNNKYDITEEIDEYNYKTINVIDKSSKKVVRKITIEPPFLDNTTIHVTEYDKNENGTGEVLLYENKGKYNIGRIDNYDYQKGEGSQIFYDDN
ncbi:MAG: hypothetical protein MJ231_05355, partial [bacterium]|nr:hypothetical protein [bacterium]